MGLSREDLIAAVTEGVRLAFAEALSKIDLSEAITDGVDASISGSEIARAVEKGVSDSFPWPSEIGQAIWEGTKVAMQDRRR